MRFAGSGILHNTTSSATSSRDMDLATLSTESRKVVCRWSAIVANFMSSRVHVQSHDISAPKSGLRSNLKTGLIQLVPDVTPTRCQHLVCVIDGRLVRLRSFHDNLGLSPSNCFSGGYTRPIFRSPEGTQPGMLRRERKSLG